MNDKMKNLAVRTLSGLVLVAVMLGAVVWSPISFGLLLAVLLVGGMLEFYALAAAKGARPQRALGTVLGLLLFCLSSPTLRKRSATGGSPLSERRSCCRCLPC